MFHPESHRRRRADRQMLAKAREERRFVPPEVRAARAAMIAAHDAARQEATQRDALERQAPITEAARILRALPAEDLSRLTTLLPRVHVAALLEAIERWER